MNSRTKTMVGMATKSATDKSFLDKVNAFFRMIKCHFLGSFKIRKRFFVLGFFAIIYAIMPIDFIPEVALGPIGLLDDMVVIGFFFSRIEKEIQRFLSWENSKNEITIIHN